MSNKKHIDRIFQESFKDFEAKPNPELWSKIQKEMTLDTETPKIAFPIWMRIAGIAAVLAILITVGSVIFTESNNEVSADEKMVDVETSSDGNLLNSDKTNASSQDYSEPNNTWDVTNLPSTQTGSTKEAETSENEIIANAELDANGNPIVDANSKRNLNSNSGSQNTTNGISSVNTVVANSDTNNNLKANNNYKNQSNIANSSNKINTQNTSNTKNGMANQDKIGTTNQTTNSDTVISNNAVESTNYVAENAPNQTGEVVSNNAVNQTSSTDKTADKNDAIAANKTSGNTSNKQTIQNNDYNNNTVASTINSDNESTKTASDVQHAVSTSETDNLLKERSPQDAIAWNAKSSNTPQNEKEKEENLMVGDSLVSESPSIEEAIAQAENITEKDEEEKLVNRWQVQANIAPVYYNSLGKGSHIDDEFVSNSKSGETNTSYGVNVSYAISKKFAIRSGISSLNLSYDTDNVILYNSPATTIPNNSNPLRNIDLAVESQTLSAFSGDNLGFQQINNELYNAAISQRLSYYEVPVELEYKLVNNRFGVNIIGGMSTFFLNDNEVYSEFEEYKTYIGEANNVNSMSFSTNLGIGLNYKFTDKLLFNFEPTFKYQLNGFDNTSGNFRPYIIGVYTGFSYKF